MQNLTDMKLVWRCKRCQAETHHDGHGGDLHCDCPEPHDEWEFQFLSGGNIFKNGTWYDVHGVLV